MVYKEIQSVIQENGGEMKGNRSSEDQDLSKLVLS